MLHVLPKLKNLWGNEKIQGENEKLMGTAEKGRGKIFEGVMTVTVNIF